MSIPLLFSDGLRMNAALFVFEFRWLSLVMLSMYHQMQWLFSSRLVSKESAGAFSLVHALYVGTALMHDLLVGG